MKKNKYNRLISVIIPVFNAKEYLFTCVESIRNQSYTNIQIILVDDGSTDGTSEICDDFSKQDKRILVIHQNNQGPTVARKAGLAVARGEYIGFADADDYMDNCMYEKLVKFIVEGKYDLVHSGYVEIPSKNTEQITFKCKEIDFENERVDKLEEFILTGEKRLSPSLFTKLYKYEFIIKCFDKVPNELRYGEDLFALCVCALEKGKLGILNEAHYYYRIREKSLSHDANSKLFCRESLLITSLITLLENYNLLDQCESILMDYALIHYMPLFSLKLGQFQIPLFDVDSQIYKNKSKVIIYGAGVVGRSFYSQISLYRNCEIVLWVDKNWKRYKYPFMEISPVEKILNVSFDYVVIAIEDLQIRENIKQGLIVMGIEQNKIFDAIPKLLYGGF